MPLTETTRAPYRRDGLHYARDATDADWEIRGRVLATLQTWFPCTVDPRAALNGILFVLRLGADGR